MIVKTLILCDGLSQLQLIWRSWEWKRQGKGKQLKETDEETFFSYLKPKSKWAVQGEINPIAYEAVCIMIAFHTNFIFHITLSHNTICPNHQIQEQHSKSNTAHLQSASSQPWESFQKNTKTKIKSRSAKVHWLKVHRPCSYTSGILKTVIVKTLLFQKLLTVRWASIDDKRTRTPTMETHNA